MESWAVGVDVEYELLRVRPICFPIFVSNVTHIRSGQKGRNSAKRSNRRTDRQPEEYGGNELLYIILSGSRF